MPRTVLRQFTGGISDEIDAQNLREDQGEEAVDINLKGFALEPGEGINPISDAKHYYYRGEWIKDSEAVSFEESGVGVVKTYDTKRPQFEEIINDKDNEARNLGPALPPGAVVTGTIVSEGTRGERPGDGAHLLELPPDKLGAIDTADPITDSPSLVEHKATATQDIDHIYYYNGQPYWVEKTGSTWNVKTRQINSAGDFTLNDITSGNCDHNSSGSFFKENYFICWNKYVIDTVVLSNSSMSVDEFDTLDTNQNGNCGSNFGFTDSDTHPATAAQGSRGGITSVDICNGIVTFAQRIETSDPTIAKYDNSDDERWILPRRNDSYIVLLRDGQAYVDWNDVEAPTQGEFGPYHVHSPDVPLSSDATLKESTGRFDEASNTVKVFTTLNQNGDATWTTPTENWPIPTWGQSYNNHTRPIGITYIVKVLPKGTWGCVRQTDTFKPEILVVEARASKRIRAADAGDVRVERTYSETARSPVSRESYRDWDDGPIKSANYQHFRIKLHINMYLPHIDGSIYWEGEPIPEMPRYYWSGKFHPAGQANEGKPIMAAVKASHTRIYTGGGQFHWSYPSNEQYAAVSLPADFSGDHYTSDQGNRQFWRRYVDHSPTSDFGNYGLKYTRGNIICWNDVGIVKNNIIVPQIWDSGLIYEPTSIRLCSYTPPSGAITLQTHAGQSSIFTTATIDSDNSISFVEATTTNFTQGDNIMVGTSGDSTKDRKIGLNLKPFAGHFTARIKKVIDASPAGKLELEAIPGYENEFMVGIKEECYPIITTINPHVGAGKFDRYGGLEFSTDVSTTRDLIRTSLEVNTLLGASHGRRWTHVGDNQLIEVRNNTGTYSKNNDLAHKINWQGDTVRAVNTSGTDIRIVYMEGGFLKSQNGEQSLKINQSSGERVGGVSPTPVLFSDTGTVHLTNTLMTVVDNGIITVYDPSFNIKFVKGRPEKPTGLGLTGEILDGFHVDNNGIFVFVKLASSEVIDDDAAGKNPELKHYWKMVKTGSPKPETSLLSYNFVKPIEFDTAGVAWGIFQDTSGNYDIHTAVPFYESSIASSWINFSANNNGDSAWGQVLKVRLSKANKDGKIKRWLSVDWKYDSGVWNSTGDPVIGLQHETNKMVGADNEFTWYLADAPSTYESNGEGTVIEKPKIAIKFKSKITRDVVFFKHTETVLPVGGATGEENRISFANYSVAGQKFYVLNNSIFDLTGEPPEEQAYQLGQTDVTEDAFDASRVGMSTFLVGAPNMYNPFGPNIDFYYRASFIDKWNNESVPSPLPTEGISPLDSADDCIQVQLSPNFFRFDNTDITKIRLYRYGGDSSEFTFLRDIPIPAITEFPIYIPASGEAGFAATFAVKAALSSFYNLNTYHDISQLSDFTNSAFDLEATPTDIDGSWRINQVYENEPRQTFTGVNDGNGGYLEINSIGHGLSNDNIIKVSTTGTLPDNLSPNVYYYVINKTADTFELSLAPGGTEIDHDGDGSGVHTWRKIVHEATLSENLNSTDTTIKLTDTTSWPTSGVVKISSEYISYSGISSNNLTGCVRGIYDTNGSDHQSGSIKSLTVTNGGTSYGMHLTPYGANDWSSADRSLTWKNVGGNLHVYSNPIYLHDDWGGALQDRVHFKTTGSLPKGLYTNTLYWVQDFISSAEVAISTTKGGDPIQVIDSDLGTGSFTYNPCVITELNLTNTFVAVEVDSELQLNATAHGLVSGQTIQVSNTGGTLPTGLSVSTNYYVSGANTNSFKVATSKGGTPITHTDNGTGTHSHTNIIEGSGFYGTYEVSNTGVITSASAFQGGTGYFSGSIGLLPNDVGTDNPEASGAVLTATHEPSPDVSPVEWVLEMEHRNQDTTTLDAAITTNSVPTTIYVASTDLFLDSGSILIGNQIIDYTAKGADGITFTGCTHNAGGGNATVHSIGVLVRSYKETYVVTSLTGVKIEINEFGYRDKARTPIMSLHSMKEDNWPPLAMAYNEEKKQFYETEVTDDFFRYVTAVGSLYFGAVDADLRFSRYGTPEYWPLEAVVTLDSEIKGIMEHAGEGIVFTTNSVYRVRGTNPKGMVAFRVPDAKGIKDGDRHSIAEFNGGIIWKTAADGICMYSAGRVSYLTRDKHDIPNMDKPYACVSDGVYWLFQRPRANRESGDTGNGFRLEITGGDLRLCQTSIQAYYAYFAKALGKAVVVTSDNSLSEADADTGFVVEEVGGQKAPNLSWRSKKIDVGEPATSKAFGSIALVYESLGSSTAPTLTDGIRGEALAVFLLGLTADGLDVGDLNPSALDGARDLYHVFTKYDSVDQEFIADIGGTDWDTDKRKTILMPEDFLTDTVVEGDSVWHEFLADNTKVESVGTEFLSSNTNTVVVSDGSSDLLFTDTDNVLTDGDEIQFTTSGTFPGNITVGTNYYVNDRTATTFKVETVVGGGNVQYSSTLGSGGLSYGRTNPTIVLDKEPLRSGTGNIIWGNLPQVHIYLNNESIPSRSFTLPPIVSEEPQSADLYLDDLRKFRTISIKVEGNVRVNTISLRHFPVQQFQSQTLHHSADIFYKGVVDFRVKLDGELIYRKELTNAGDEFTEERIYLPASSFGSRVHYMNESRSGMIESVTFNGSLAA